MEVGRCFGASVLRYVGGDGGSVTGWIVWIPFFIRVLPLVLHLAPQVEGKLTTCQEIVGNWPNGCR